MQTCFHRELYTLCYIPTYLILTCGGVGVGIQVIISCLSFLCITGREGHVSKKSAEENISEFSETTMTEKVKYKNVIAFLQVL